MSPDVVRQEAAPAAGSGQPRIAFLAAGAAGMYCGSCLRDNALANALHARGEDIVLVPTYTPLKVDESTLSGERVFLGAIEVYLHQKLPFLRNRGGLLRRMIGSQKVLRWISRFALSTNPAGLGELTIGMLQGEAGPQGRLLTELVDWLQREICPSVVHLSNSLFSGFAREIKRRLRVPVVCGLQGEALFLQGLPEPHRGRVLALLRERGADVDRFLASSEYEADHMATWVGLDRSRIDVVWPGIRSTDFGGADPASGQRPPTIGFFARMAPEKGLHVLCDAFRLLASSGEWKDLRLRAAGFLGGKDLHYVAQLRRLLARAGLSRRVEILGTVDREEKIRFLQDLDVFSVPTAFPEPKGIFLLEAMAAGVPVAAPEHGSFPELLRATGGGILHRPNDPEDLARALAELLRDGERRRALGSSGQRSVLERFTTDRMALETLEVYRKLLAPQVP